MLKMPIEFLKLVVMHNVPIMKKSNSWTMDDTGNFSCL